MSVWLSCLLAFSPFWDSVGKSEDSVSQEQSMQLPENGVFRGIVLKSHLSSIDPNEVSLIDGIFVHENLFLAESLEVLQHQLWPLIKYQEINRKNLLFIKEKILEFYKDRRQPMISIEIPEQDVTSGVVTFVVVHPHIAKVDYLENKWFSTHLFEKQLNLYPGEPLDEEKLLNKVFRLNQNPFHFTEVVLSPGQEKGETNVEVVTKDRFPLRAYTGADNTGTAATGKSRYSAGFTWGNAFGIDDLLTYQFTCNKEYNKLSSHSIQYLSSFSWDHSLSFSAAYARIHPEISPLISNAKAVLANLRYQIPFKPFYARFQQQFSFGFDYKYVTSSLFFLGEVPPAELLVISKENVTQFTLGYMINYSIGGHQLTFGLDFFGSPVKWLPFQTNAAYGTLRSGSKPRYCYLTCTLGDTYFFPTQDSLSLLLRMQGASSLLPPSEQFIVGGYYTVRGYEEGAFAGDNGVCVNFEMKTRPLSFVKKWQDQLTFLGFIDYGWAYNYRADGTLKATYLLGIGPGLRYSIGPYLNARLDYGFKLHSVPFDTNDLGNWHGAITASY